MSINNVGKYQLKKYIRREEMNFSFKVTPANREEVNYKLKKLINAGFISLNSWDLEMPGIYFERKINFKGQKWHSKLQRGITWIIVWEDEILIKYWGFKHHPPMKLPPSKKKILKMIKELLKSEKNYYNNTKDKFSEGSIDCYKFLINNIKLLSDDFLKIRKLINHRINEIQKMTKVISNKYYIGYLDTLSQVFQIIHQNKNWNYKR